MPISVQVILALALVTLIATCAKVCFSLMGEAEKNQQEAQVGEPECAQR